MPARPYWVFLAATLLLAAMHLHWGYNHLPESVATHFGGGGEPDGWSSRAGWAVLYAVLLAISGGLFAVLAAALPRFPAASFNLPRRDYWLDPARRERTVRTIAERLLVLGGVTVLFDLGIMHLTVIANQPGEGRLSDRFGWLLGGYLAFVAGWTVWLIVSFRAPAGAGSDPR